MEKLIKTINEIIKSEYKDTDLNPEIILTAGHDHKDARTYHLIIYLKFNKNGKTIKYSLTRLSDTLSDFHTPDQIIELLEYAYKHFVNSLLFSVGQLRIAEILNGDIEESLIIN